MYMHLHTMYVVGFSARYKNVQILQFHIYLQKYSTDIVQIFCGN